MRKTTQILLATCFAALATFSSCKKEKPNTAQETPLPTGSISGNVVVPNGTTTDVNTFKVLSVLQETNVANSSYTVETYSDDFTTQIVSNANDKVVMMGYNYPGQTDHTISSRSTALALVMNCPASIFLTPNGKQQLISNVLASPKLGNLVSAIDNIILSNSNLFDTANNTIAGALDMLFTDASFKTDNSQTTSPVIFTKAGKILSFQNNTRANSTVVGIYKGGQRIQKIVVDGLQIFPTSISEIINGYGGISADPVLNDYTLPAGNADYEIKMRTGLLTNNDGSTEYYEARNENLFLFFNGMITAYAPQLKSTSCKAATRQFLLGLINDLQPYSGNSLAGIGAYVLDVSNFIFSQAGAITTACCPPPTKKFLGIIGVAVKFVSDKLNVFSGAANAANQLLFIENWKNSTVAIDTCLTVQGNTVGPCMNTVSDIDGNVYHTVQIGNQIWLKENLRTTHYSNGDAIAVFTDSTELCSLGNSGLGAYGTCYPTVNVAFGNYYNGYAAADARNACPAGWRVSTQADFNELLYGLDLPGTPVADLLASGNSTDGTSYWSGNNTGTNTSGFTAQPNGDLACNNYHGSTGTTACFWTNTSAASSELILLNLAVANPTPYFTNANKIYGNGIRCIKAQ